MMQSSISTFIAFFSYAKPWRPRIIWASFCSITNIFKISIYDLEEAINIVFPTNRDYDTLGGFILYQLQDIPKNNDIVEFNGITFHVKSMNDNRVGLINVIKSTQ